MSFDTAKFKLSQSNLPLGKLYCRLTSEYHVNGSTECGGSICERVNQKIETLENIAQTVGNSTHFGVIAKNKLDCRTFLLSKINNAGLVGLGYMQTLQLGVGFILSVLIDGKDFNAGGHRVGLGCELEA